MANEHHTEGEADRTKGKLKEGAGKVTGDRELEQEGKADQSKGSMKKAAGDVKDAVKGK
jgi:uncharacterized protein YjbJ (UPF0337 family)